MYLLLFFLFMTSVCQKAIVQNNINIMQSKSLQTNKKNN